MRLLHTVSIIALPVLVLAGCTATTGGAPASGGLGMTAAGGLLAANNAGSLPATTQQHLAGRLFDGRYALLLGSGDLARAQGAAITAFESTPSGQTTIWRNPVNGHWGTLTPSRTYRDAGGRYCRDYRQTVTIGGQEHQGNGAACREPDGVWRIMS